MANSKDCHYQTWEWDSINHKSVNFKKIIKEKSNLTLEEKGNVPGCSVCEEDQVEIKLPSLPPFKFCKKFESKIRTVIQGIQKANFPLLKIVGYRVGKSRGKTNSYGLRTEFSNHSYGTAIDFNEDQNGLYDLCFHFSSSCKLTRGGTYTPGKQGSITKSSIIYLLMKKEGFLWGGEIQGKQKDFMHFSLTGT